MDLVRLTCCLILLTSATFSCRMEDNRYRSQIAHQTREMIRQYNEGNTAGLSSYFVDSAYLSGPGGYRVQGKEVVSDFWGRHFIPLNWQSQTAGYYTNLEEVNAQLAPDVQLPGVSETIPSDLEGTIKQVYESATWTWTFQREEGIFQKEENQVIVYWTQTGNGTWKISELFLY